MRRHQLCYHVHDDGKVCLTSDVTPELAKALIAELAVMVARQKPMVINVDVIEQSRSQEPMVINVGVEQSRK
jgi:hypothetical protein